MGCTLQCKETHKGGLVVVLRALTRCVGVVDLKSMCMGGGGHTHPHQELPAGQVVVVVGEDVRQLLEGLHAVPAAGTE